MKPLTGLLFSLLFAALQLSAADLTISFNTQGKGILSSASGKQTEYVTSKFMLTRDEGTGVDTLVDYVQGATYTIQHKKKTIEVMTFDDALALLEQSQAASAMPKEISGFLGKMMGGDASDVSVDKTGNEVVAERTCSAYKIKVGKLTMDLCADPNLKTPVPEAAWSKSLRMRAAAAAAAGPMAASYKRLYEELSKIKGVVLKSKLMSIERTATKVVEGPVDASVFALPAGYKTEDVGKKMRAELAKGAR